MGVELTRAWLEGFSLIIPELVLVVAACVLLVGATFQVSRHVWGAVALIGLAGAAFYLRFSPLTPPSTTTALVSTLLADHLGLFARWVAILGGCLLVLLSWDQIPDSRAAEYHSCLLFITAGVCLTSIANDLVMLFLALELISIPTYVLLYLPRTDRPAQEAALKYFLLSIFSSALLLFGFSYLYGLAGSTSMPAIEDALTNPAPEGAPLLGLSSVALVMIVAALGFRITAVPFHFYAPDVYQGTNPAAAAMLAFVPKIAGFVALLRLLGFVLADNAGTGLMLGPQVPSLLWILAAVTMTVGNLLALLQDNLKRLLAYSSVAHAGYMLIGLAAAPDLHGEATGGTDAVLFYLVAYGAMTLGAFTVISYLSTAERPIETVDDLAGLSRSHPGIALMMGLFLLSLIGIPMTAGFMGKFLLFFSAMSVPTEEHAFLFRTLALIASLNAAAGAWYYLRILMVMYLRNAIRPIDTNIRSLPGLATLWLCAALTLGLGVYPHPLVEQARLAVGRPTPPVVEG